MKKFGIRLLAASFCALTSTVAGAQDFPRRAITMVLPYAAGGVTDTMARLVAAKVSENIGQPVVVENRPGGGGQVAAGVVKQAAPDGYTLLIGDIGTHAINVSLYSKLSYNPAKDFVPIIKLVELPHVLVVPLDRPFKTFTELVAWARKNPGALTYASVGVGSGAHLLGELLKSGFHIDIVHAPYRGSSQIVPDLMSGRMGLFFGAVGSMAPLIGEGKLRGLMVTDRQRSSLLPDIPSAVEVSAPMLELKVWFGVFAPAATPGTIVERLNAEFAKALAQPEVRQRLTKLGANIVANSPKEFADLVAADTLRLSKVVKDSGAHVD